MKRTIQIWAAPVCLCGLMGVFAIAATPWVLSQSPNPDLREAEESKEDDGNEQDDDAPMAEEAEFLQDSAENQAIEDGDSEGADDASGGDNAPEDSENQASEFESRTDELVSQIHEAISNRQLQQVEELKSELTNVTRDYFQWLEAKRRAQVDALEAKLEALKQVLAARDQNADQIVQRRVKKLIGESDALDWNPKIGIKEGLGEKQKQPSPQKFMEALRAVDAARESVDRQSERKEPKRETRNIHTNDLEPGRLLVLLKLVLPGYDLSVNPEKSGIVASGTRKELDEVAEVILATMDSELASFFKPQPIQNSPKSLNRFFKPPSESELFEKQVRQILKNMQSRQAANQMIRDNLESQIRKLESSPERLASTSHSNEIEQQIKNLQSDRERYLEESKKYEKLINRAQKP